MEQVKVAYNDSFKLMFGYSRRCSASLMLAKNHVKDIFVMRRNAAYSLLCRLAESENIIIRAILISKVFNHLTVEGAIT